jgi:hypothetical protein
MVNAAIQVAKLLEESERLTTGQAKQAVVLVSDVSQATATNYKAKQDLLQARLGYFIGARRANGRRPGTGIGNTMKTRRRIKMGFTMLSGLLPWVKMLRHSSFSG